MDTPDKGIFDRFAGAVNTVASRAPFFAFCVLLVVIWAPSFLFLPFDTWQLIINTATTIITFLLVALFQNSSTRTSTAIQRKLDAQSRGLRAALEFAAEVAGRDFTAEIAELDEAVGLEAGVGTKRSSTKGA